MVRKTSMRLYVAAAIITMLVFTTGLLLGFLVEGKRIGYIQQQDFEKGIELESLQVQYLYISVLGQEKNCRAMETTLSTSVKALEETRQRLEDYTKDSILNTNDFNLLLRQYMIQETRYWLLSKQAKEMCKSDTVTILNFHNKECNGCEEEGFILNYMKKKLGDKLLIFSFDIDFKEEPTLSMLINTYNITKTPTLIVEGQKIEGPTTKEKLEEIICNKYESKLQECSS